MLSAVLVWLEFELVLKVVVEVVMVVMGVGEE